MKKFLDSIALLLCLCFGISSSARGSMTLVAGPGLPHPGNLVANGSFELGHPAGPGWANNQYWATGTAYTPYSLPPGWTSSGPGGNYAAWGSDNTGLPIIQRGSDNLPDGLLGLYFGNGGASPNQPPTFNPDGTVSFPSSPTFAMGFGVTVVLSQTVNTQLSPAPSYTISFWASGKSAYFGASADEGIFGFRMTNVLSGDPIQYLTVPAGLGPQGASRFYRYNFVPLNASLPVTIEYTNWGHLDLTPFGGNGTTELVLDDVVIQPQLVPEPSSAALAALGLIGLLAHGWRRQKTER